MVGSVLGEHSGSPAGASLVPGETLPDHLAQREREIVRAALEAADWNQSEAARRLGVSEAKVRKCVRQYGITRPGMRPPAWRAALRRRRSRRSRHRGACPHLVHPSACRSGHLSAQGGPAASFAAVLPLRRIWRSPCVAP